MEKVFLLCFYFPLSCLPIKICIVWICLSIRMTWVLLQLNSGLTVQNNCIFLFVNFRNLDGRGWVQFIMDRLCQSILLLKHGHPTYTTFSFPSTHFLQYLTDCLATASNVTSTMQWTRWKGCFGMFWFENGTFLSQCIEWERAIPEILYTKMSIVFGNGNFFGSYFHGFSIFWLTLMRIIRESWMFAWFCTQPLPIFCFECVCFTFLSFNKFEIFKDLVGQWVSKWNSVSSKNFIECLYDTRWVGVLFFSLKKGLSVHYGRHALVNAECYFKIHLKMVPRNRSSLFMSLTKSV